MAPAVFPAAASTPAPIIETTEIPEAKPVRRVARAAMVAPKPIREVAPVAADSIRNRIDDEIPVYVTMRIGPNGLVTAAEAVKGSDGIQAYLSQRALEAARQWRFRPARLGPDAVPSKFTVRFLFQKSGVEWN
jgi:TonB family protein